MEYEKIEACDLCSSRNLKTIDAAHNICQCGSCRFIFDNPRPTLKEVSEYYSRENKYDPWLLQEKAREWVWEKRLEKILKFKSSGQLLDVGTGIGQFLAQAKKYFNVFGTEVSRSAIRWAKEKYQLPLLLGPLEDLDFKGQSFEVITLFHVLEHVPSPTAIIRKCRELLNPGGILVLAVPNDTRSFTERPLKRLLAILGIGKFKRYGKYCLPKIVLDGSLAEIHVSHFSVSTLKPWLKRQGLQLLDSGLDRYYVNQGVRRWIYHCFYAVSYVIHKLFRVNLYDTIWMVAKKDN
jgi:SAM-dependent methyltransferase